MQVKRIWQRAANQALVFVMCWSWTRCARRDSKRRDLAAAAGDICKTSGAEAREEAAEFATEQIRCEIDEHVAEIDLPDIRDVRKQFAADGDALLNDPDAICGGQGAFDGLIPSSFAGFPAEGDAGAAILVARFEYQVFALPADEGEQLDGLAVMVGLDVRDDTRPGDVSLNQFAFAVRKERAVLRIRQHREKGLHMRDFAAEIVGDADGVRGIGFDQRRTFGGPGDDVVDKHAAVDEVDLLVLGDEGFAVPLELARVGDERWDAHSLEAILEDFEFAPGGDLFPIHNGDLGLRGGPAPVPIGSHQRIEKLGAERIDVDFIFPGKLSRHRKFAEYLSKGFRVAGAGG